MRRIVQSQKDFQYHLNEEEASLAQTAQTLTGAGAGAGVTTQRPGLLSRITKPAQRRSATPVTPAAKAGAGRKRKQAPVAPTEETPAADTATPQAPQADADAEKNHLIASEYDNDPLLRSRMPPVPSERIMQALVCEPPLPYNAARVGPSISRKPPRFFCAICGYWGKIRCRGCHVRTCGLDCYKVHEESRCGAFL